MADIRVFESGDLPAVAALLRAHMPRWALDEDLLAATTLDAPWSDAALPSLVAIGDGGRVIGFVGSQVRRMRFDGNAIRGVCACDLIVDPEHRSGAPGVMLLSRVLSGPQDVTWSDSATDEVARVWRTVGGGVDYARAADFMLVLRPGAWLRSLVKARVHRRYPGPDVVPVRALPSDMARGWRSRKYGGPGDGGVEGRDASPAEVVEQLERISSRNRVRVDWDEAQLAHTLRQVGKLDGTPACRLVLRRGRAIGWYVCVLRPGGVSRVLHLAAIERSADAVFAELVNCATLAGSAVLAGRAEPHLELSLRSRQAVLNFVWQPVIRAGDPALASALTTESSLLTRLDGELSAL